MNREENNNAARTATTSPSALKTPPTSKAAKELGQSEFLARQGRDAKAAIAAALSDAARSVGRGINPAPVTKKHPWLGVAGAAAVGLGAAMTLDHLKESRRQRAEERRLHPAPHPPANGFAHGPPPKSPGIMGRLLSELLIALKPALLAFVTSQMGGHGHDEAKKPDSGRPKVDGSQSDKAPNASYNDNPPASGSSTPPPT